MCTYYDKNISKFERDKYALLCNTFITVMCLIFLVWMEYYNVVTESKQYVLYGIKKKLNYIEKYLYFKFRQ